MRFRFGPLFVVVALAGALSSFSEPAYGQGAYISAAGPVNRSMGGASAAAPINALGALYWNPATISGIEHPELEFGVGLLFADHDVSSSFGPISGTTHGQLGTFPLPNVGWVYHTQNPAVTLGLGIHSVAGFKTNLPADPANPVLAPSPAGLGRVSSEAAFMQITPVVSYAATESLSIAVGPTITTAQVAAEPFVFDAANIDGTYSPGRSTRYHWGGGVQAGVYYIHNEYLRFGASLKSPTWMERFEFYGEDANGGPRTLHVDLDLPMILSVGTSVIPSDGWLIALDLRYLDYENTDGFGDRAVYDVTGRLQGLDWSSVLAVAMGVQHRLTESVLVRGGYTYNQNPIKHSESFFAIAAPLIYEHMLSVGASYEVNELLALNVAYSHVFQNDREGPIVMPGIGAVPGTNVTNELTAHVVSFGIVMRH